MLFAFRNIFLIVKKIAVLIWGQKYCRGYTEVMKNVKGTLQTS